MEAMETCIMEYPSRQGTVCPESIDPGKVHGPHQRHRHRRRFIDLWFTLGFSILHEHGNLCNNISQLDEELWIGEKHIQRLIHQQEFLARQMVEFFVKESEEFVATQGQWERKDKISPRSLTLGQKKDDSSG
ncbi:hypothetical protein AMTR_s00126p00074230 [Amborella trichopoda]|uniref:Uncharacterized protein n=1 Tax=Amborella trichopoda TaxID=13333 RepID=W1NN95_AMBTC|nr:hypothetical protein AMTR_s00126p00074230 [Amborella trichopoda]